MPITSVSFYQKVQLHRGEVARAATDTTMREMLSKRREELQRSLERDNKLLWIFARAQEVVLCTVGTIISRSGRLRPSAFKIFSSVSEKKLTRDADEMHWTETISPGALVTGYEWLLSQLEQVENGALERQAASALVAVASAQGKKSERVANFLGETCAKLCERLLASGLGSFAHSAGFSTSAASVSPERSGANDTRRKLNH